MNRFFVFSSGRIVYVHSEALHLRWATPKLNLNILRTDVSTQNTIY